MIVTADVIDVSRSGLQLEVDEPIELAGCGKMAISSRFRNLLSAESIGWTQYAA